MTAPLSVCVDLRPTQTAHRLRGVGTYLEQLSRALVRLDTPVRFTFVQYEGPSPFDLDAVPDVHRVVRRGRPPRHATPRNLKDRMWQPLRLKRSEFDAVLLPDIARGFPRGGVPVVPIVYDLIPLLFSSRYFGRHVGSFQSQDRREALMRRLAAWLYRQQLATLTDAAGIITISKSTRRDLVEHLGIDTPIEVVYPGTDEQLSSEAPTERSLLARFGLRRPFLLYVGGNDFRKNVSALVKAFEELRRHRSVQLVLAGRDFEADVLRREGPELNRRIRASLYASDIRLLGYVPRPDLSALLQAADVFVFPSLYEGFGLPLLEAMSSGAPVVALRNSAVPEVLGEAGIMVDDERELADAVGRVLDDPVLRSRLRSAGRHRARQFSWRHAAQRTVEFLRRIVDKATG